MKARHVATATGEFLTRASKSDFDNDRKVAVAARRMISFTMDTGEASTDVPAGELVVAYVNDLSITYRSIATTTLVPGATVAVLCECERAGMVGNVASGTLTEMIATYPGVSCVDTATVRLGVDEESDAKLFARDTSKWAALSYENTVEAITYLITTKVPNITAVKIDDLNPHGAGTVDIYCAGDNATAGESDVTAALAVARARYFDPDPRIQVYAAPTQTLTASGTVLCDSTVGTVATRANVEAALLNMLKELPIGGRTYLNGPSRILAFDDIIEAIRSAKGVVSVTLTAPTANVSIGEFSKLIAPASWGLTYTSTTVT